jgi:hypothetical protein
VEDANNPANRAHLRHHVPPLLRHTGSMSTPHEHAVWPLSKSGTETRALAPRLKSLDHARVGFLWDYVFRGDELFPVLAAELRRRFPKIEIVQYDTFGNTHGADEVEVIRALPARLRENGITAVVSAMGC